MKLNLVPATAKKGAQMRTMVVASVLLVVGSALATAFLAYSSGQALANAKSEAQTHMQGAVDAVATAKHATAILESSKGVVTNLDLANQMTAHNTKYTSFYTKVTPYIPGFMRVTSMSVTPINETSCRLNLSGVILTAQQYADLSLALLRIPGAQAISRSGFVRQSDTVLPLNEADQRGAVVRAGEDALPIDPVERMEVVIARATEQTTGFDNVGNFGSPVESARGAMDRWSQISVSVLLAQPAGAELPPGWDFNFLVPNPTSTLQGARQFNQAAGAAGAAPGGAPPGGVPPGGTLQVGGGAASVRGRD